jgi:hypothetical protein
MRAAHFWFVIPRNVRRPSIASVASLQLSLNWLNIGRLERIIAMSAVTFVQGGSPINPDLKRVSVPYTLHPTPYTLHPARSAITTGN